MIKLASQYNVFFIHSNDDQDSLDLVLNDLSSVPGFGSLLTSDTHRVVLCTDTFAKAFDKHVLDKYQGGMWMTKYDLHPKRLPTTNAEKTIKVGIPFDMTSLQAKLQLRNIVDEIGKYIPVSSDHLQVRVPLLDGKHRGFGFLEFDAADEAIAIVKMFLSTYEYRDTKRKDIHVSWFQRVRTPRVHKDKVLHEKEADVPVKEVNVVLSVAKSIKQTAPIVNKTILRRKKVDVKQ